MKKYSIKKFWNWLTSLRKVKAEYRFCQTRTETTGQDASNYELGARLVQAFSDLEKLEDDWNTYGAPAPSSETIELARRICSIFPRKLQPEISPEVDGSISLCWNLDLVYVLTLKHGSVPIFGIETTGGYILYDEANLDMDVELSEFPEFLVKYFDEK